MVFFQYVGARNKWFCRGHRHVPIPNIITCRSLIHRCSIHDEAVLVWDNNAAQVCLGLQSGSSCQNCIFLDWRWASFTSILFSSAVMNCHLLSPQQTKWITVCSNSEHQERLIVEAFYLLHLLWSHIQPEDNYSTFAVVLCTRLHPEPRQRFLHRLLFLNWVESYPPLRVEVFWMTGGCIGCYLVGI